MQMMENNLNVTRTVKPRGRSEVTEQGFIKLIMWILMMFTGIGIALGICISPWYFLMCAPLVILIVLAAGAK